MESQILQTKKELIVVTFPIQRRKGQLPEPSGRQRFYIKSVSQDNQFGMQKWQQAWPLSLSSSLLHRLLYITIPVSRQLVPFKGEMARQWALCQRTRAQFLAPTWQLTVVCNYNPDFITEVLHLPVWSLKWARTYIRAVTLLHFPTIRNSLWLLGEI